jgi:16S rRNA (guanine966-N2)-methyltransferase
VKQVVRIIGGRYRGKKIAFPESAGLRPTPDRIRETLFNWLMHDIRQARCLDAFAGSGALGLEAFSRGAAEVYFLEQNPTVFKTLQSNISQFDSDQLHVIHINALDYLHHIETPFDIIFLDPPFASALLTDCLHILSSNTLLKPEGLLYTESPYEITVDFTYWEVLKQKKAGRVFYGLIRKKNNRVWDELSISHTK